VGTSGASVGGLNTLAAVLRQLVTEGAPAGLAAERARRYGGPGWGLATCERGLPGRSGSWPG